MAKFYEIEVGTGYVGEEETYLYEFPDTADDDDVREYAQDLAVDNAEMYGRDTEEDLENITSVVTRIDMPVEEMLETYGEILTP